MANKKKQNQPMDFSVPPIEGGALNPSVFSALTPEQKDRMYAAQLGHQARQEANNGFTPGGDTFRNNGIWDTGVDAIQAGALNVGAGVLEAADHVMDQYGIGNKNGALKSASDYLSDWAAYNSEDPSQLNGARYAAYGIGNAIGSTLPSLLLGAALSATGTAVAPAAATVVGVATAAGKAAKVASCISKIWNSPFGRMMTGQVAGSFIEASAEAGNVVKELRDLGYDDETISTAAGKSFGGNVGVLVTSDLVTGGVIGHALGKFGTKAVEKGMVKEALAKGTSKAPSGWLRGGVENLTTAGGRLLSKEGAVKTAEVLGLGALNEGGQEYAQSAVEDWATGNSFDSEKAWESAKLGAIGGAFLGGATATMATAAGGSNFDFRTISPKDGEEHTFSASPADKYGRRSFAMDDKWISRGNFATMLGLDAKELNNVLGAEDPMAPISKAGLKEEDNLDAIIAQYIVPQDENDRDDIKVNPEGGFKDEEFYKQAANIPTADYATKYKFVNDYVDKHNARVEADRKNGIKVQDVKPEEPKAKTAPEETKVNEQKVNEQPAEDVKQQEGTPPEQQGDGNATGQPPMQPGVTPAGTGTGTDATTNTGDTIKVEGEKPEVLPPEGQPPVALNNPIQKESNAAEAMKALDTAGAHLKSMAEGYNTDVAGMTDEQRLQHDSEMGKAKDGYAYSAENALVTALGATDEKTSNDMLAKRAAMAQGIRDTVKALGLNPSPKLESLLRDADAKFKPKAEQTVVQGLTPAPAEAPVVVKNATPENKVIEKGEELDDENAENKDSKLTKGEPEKTSDEAPETREGEEAKPSRSEVIARNKKIKTFLETLNTLLNNGQYEGDIHDRGIVDFYNQLDEGGKKEFVKRFKKEVVGRNKVTWSDILAQLGEPAEAPKAPAPKNTIPKNAGNEEKSNKGAEALKAIRPKDKPDKRIQIKSKVQYGPASEEAERVFANRISDEDKLQSARRGFKTIRDSADMGAIEINASDTELANAIVDAMDDVLSPNDLNKVVAKLNKQETFDDETSDAVKQGKVAPNPRSGVKKATAKEFSAVDKTISYYIEEADKAYKSMWEKVDKINKEKGTDTAIPDMNKLNRTMTKTFDSMVNSIRKNSKELKYKLEKNFADTIETMRDTANKRVADLDEELLEKEEPIFDAWNALEDKMKANKASAEEIDEATKGFKEQKDALEKEYADKKAAILKELDKEITKLKDSRADSIAKEVAAAKEQADADVRKAAQKWAKASLAFYSAAKQQQAVAAAIAEAQRAAKLAGDKDPTKALSMLLADFDKLGGTPTHSPDHDKLHAVLAKLQDAVSPKDKDGKPIPVEKWSKSDKAQYIGRFKEVLSGKVKNVDIYTSGNQREVFDIISKYVRDYNSINKENPLSNLKTVGLSNGRWAIVAEEPVTRKVQNKDGKEELVTKLEEKVLYNSSKDKAFTYSPSGEHGKTYIVFNLDTMDASTPIHEYYHVFLQMYRNSNPAAWNKMANTFRSTALFQYLKGQYKKNDTFGQITDDYVLEETLAYAGGYRGADLLQKVQKCSDNNTSKQSGAVNHIHESANKIWSSVAAWFGFGKPKKTNAQIVDRLRTQAFLEMPFAALLNEKVTDRNLVSEASLDLAVNRMALAVSMGTLEKGEAIRQIDYLFNDAKASGLFPDENFLTKFRAVCDMKFDEIANTPIGKSSAFNAAYLGIQNKLDELMRADFTNRFDAKNTSKIQSGQDGEDEEGEKKRFISISETFHTLFLDGTAENPRELLSAVGLAKLAADNGAPSGSELKPLEISMLRADTAIRMLKDVKTMESQGKTYGPYYHDIMVGLAAQFAMAMRQMGVYDDAKAMSICKVADSELRESSKKGLWNALRGEGDKPFLGVGDNISDPGNKSLLVFVDKNNPKVILGTDTEDVKGLDFTVKALDDVLMEATSNKITVAKHGGKIANQAANLFSEHRRRYLAASGLTSETLDMLLNPKDLEKYIGSIFGGPESACLRNSGMDTAEYTSIVGALLDQRAANGKHLNVSKSQAELQAELMKKQEIFGDDITFGKAFWEDPTEFAKNYFYCTEDDDYVDAERSAHTMLIRQGLSAMEYYSVNKEWNLRHIISSKNEERNRTELLWYQEMRDSKSIYGYNSLPDATKQLIEDRRHLPLAVAYTDLYLASRATPAFVNLHDAAYVLLNLFCEDSGVGLFESAHWGGVVNNLLEDFNVLMASSSTRDIINNINKAGSDLAHDADITRVQLRRGLLNEDHPDSDAKSVTEEEFRAADQALRNAYFGQRDLPFAISMPLGHLANSVAPMMKPKSERTFYSGDAAIRLTFMVNHLIYAASQSGGRSNAKVKPLKDFEPASIKKYIQIACAESLTKNGEPIGQSVIMTDEFARLCSAILKGLDSQRGGMKELFNIAIQKDKKTDKNVADLTRVKLSFAISQKLTPLMFWLGGVRFDSAERLESIIDDRLREFDAPAYAISPNEKTQTTITKLGRGFAKDVLVKDFEDYFGKDASRDKINQKATELNDAMNFAVKEIFKNTLLYQFQDNNPANYDPVYERAAHVFEAMEQISRWAGTISHEKAYITKGNEQYGIPPAVNYKPNYHKRVEALARLSAIGVIPTLEEYQNGTYYEDAQIRFTKELDTIVNSYEKAAKKLGYVNTGGYFLFNHNLSENNDALADTYSIEAKSAQKSGQEQVVSDYQGGGTKNIDAEMEEKAFTENQLSTITSGESDNKQAAKNIYKKIHASLEDMLFVKPHDGMFDSAVDMDELNVMYQGAQLASQVRATWKMWRGHNADGLFEMFITDLVDDPPPPDFDVTGLRNKGIPLREVLSTTWKDNAYCKDNILDESDELYDLYDEEIGTIVKKLGESSEEYIAAGLSRPNATNISSTKRYITSFSDAYHDLRHVFEAYAAQKQKDKINESGTGLFTRGNRDVIARALSDRASMSYNKNELVGKFFVSSDPSYPEDSLGRFKRSPNYKKVSESFDNSITTIQAKNDLEASDLSKEQITEAMKNLKVEWMAKGEKLSNWFNGYKPFKDMVTPFDMGFLGTMKKFNATFYTIKDQNIKGVAFVPKTATGESVLCTPIFINMTGIKDNSVIGKVEELCNFIELKQDQMFPGDNYGSLADRIVRAAMPGAVKDGEQKEQEKQIRKFTSAYPDLAFKWFRTINDSDITKANQIKFFSDSNYVKIDTASDGMIYTSSKLEEDFAKLLVTRKFGTCSENNKLNLTEAGMFTYDGGVNYLSSNYGCKLTKATSRRIMNLVKDEHSLLIAPTQTEQYVTVMDCAFSELIDRKLNSEALTEAQLKTLSDQRDAFYAAIEQYKADLRSGATSTDGNEKSEQKLFGVIQKIIGANTLGENAIPEFSNIYREVHQGFQAVHARYAPDPQESAYAKLMDFDVFGRPVGDVQENGRYSQMTFVDDILSQTDDPIIAGISRRYLENIGGNTGSKMAQGAVAALEKNLKAVKAAVDKLSPQTDGGTNAVLTYYVVMKGLTNDLEVNTDLKAVDRRIKELNKMLSENKEVTLNEVLMGLAKDKFGLDLQKEFAYKLGMGNIGRSSAKRKNSTGANTRTNLEYDALKNILEYQLSKSDSGVRNGWPAIFGARRYSYLANGGDISWLASAVKSSRSDGSGAGNVQPNQGRESGLSTSIGDRVGRDAIVRDLSEASVAKPLIEWYSVETTPEERDAIKEQDPYIDFLNWQSKRRREASDEKLRERYFINYQSIFSDAAQATSDMAADLKYSLSGAVHKMGMDRVNYDYESGFGTNLANDTDTAKEKKAVHMNLWDSMFASVHSIARQRGKEFLDKIYKALRDGCAKVERYREEYSQRWEEICALLEGDIKDQRDYNNIIIQLDRMNTKGKGDATAEEIRNLVDANGNKYNPSENCVAAIMKTHKMMKDLWVEEEKAYRSVEEVRMKPISTTTACRHYFLGDLFYEDMKFSLGKETIDKFKGNHGIIPGKEYAVAVYKGHPGAVDNLDGTFTVYFFDDAGTKRQITLDGTEKIYLSYDSPHVYQGSAAGLTLKQVKNIQNNPYYRVEGAISEHHGERINTDTNKFEPFTEYMISYQYVKPKTDPRDNYFPHKFGTFSVVRKHRIHTGLVSDEIRVMEIADRMKRFRAGNVVHLTNEGRKAVEFINLSGNDAKIFYKDGTTQKLRANDLAQFEYDAYETSTDVADALIASAEGLQEAAKLARIQEDAMRQTETDPRFKDDIVIVKTAAYADSDIFLDDVTGLRYQPGTDFNKILMLGRILQDYHGMSAVEAEQICNLWSANELHTRRNFAHLKERDGVAGYTENTYEVIPKYITQATRFIGMSDAKRNAIVEFEKKYGVDSYLTMATNRDQVAAYAKELIHITNGGQSDSEAVLNSCLHSIEWFNAFTQKWFGRDAGARIPLLIANKMNGLVAPSLLGMLNVGSALVNMTQIKNTYAKLGWKYTKVGLEAALDVIRNKDKSDPKYQEYMRVLKGAHTYERAGLADVRLNGKRNTLFSSAIGFGEDTAWSKAKRCLSWMSQKGMCLFEGTEKICRTAATIGAYEKFKAMSHEEQIAALRRENINVLDLANVNSSGKVTDHAAMAYAEAVDVFANFDYGIYDAPGIYRRWAGTGIAEVMLLFKKYTFKEAENHINAFFKSEANGGMSREEKIRFITTNALLCSAFGFPGADLLSDLLEKMLGINKATIRQAMFDNFGDNPLTRIAAYGVGGLVGVDITNRISLAGILPTKINPAELLLGAHYGVISNSISAALRGDATGVAKALVPSVGNFTMGVTGVKYNRSGLPSYKYGGLERLSRAIGISTIGESMATNKMLADRANKNREKEERKDARNYLVRKMLNDEHMDYDDYDLRRQHNISQDELNKLYLKYLQIKMTGHE